MYMIHTFQSNPRDCTGQYIKCKRQINDIQRKPYVVKKKKKKPLGLLAKTWESALHTFHTKKKALYETQAGAEKRLEAI